MISKRQLNELDSQENGTCATIISLWNTTKDALRTSNLEQSFDRAPPLSLNDIRLNTAEHKLFRDSLVQIVLRVAVRYGGPNFKRFQDDIRMHRTRSERVIEVHKTNVYPLPAMNINESSTAGNAEVVDTVMKELKLDQTKHDFADFVKPIAGDQLSIARLRSIVEARSGNEGGPGSYSWAVFVPGLFHYKIAATVGFFHTHLGKLGHDTVNPGSLAAHNAALGRKPILITSLPPFRTCRDLIFISLYARLFHCLLLVANKPSATLDEYAEDLSFDELVTHAEEVIDRYTDGRTVHRLRRARKKDGEEYGDMVFENAILFLRDGLILREFCDAVKDGDSGRIITVLKLLALSYRGSGRTKYAQEALFLVHNLTNVWPKSLVYVFKSLHMLCDFDLTSDSDHTYRDCILNNWLVNTTGKTGGFCEVDLLQEHLNYWIKVRLTPFCLSTT